MKLKGIKILTTTFVIAASACSCETPNALEDTPTSKLAENPNKTIVYKQKVSKSQLDLLPKLDKKSHSNALQFINKAEVRKDVQSLLARYMIFKKAKRAWALTSDAGWADDGQTAIIEMNDGTIESIYFRNINKGIETKGVSNTQYRQFLNGISQWKSLRNYAPEVLDSLRYEVTSFELSGNKFYGMHRLFMNSVGSSPKKDDYMKVVSSFQKLR